MSEGNTTSESLYRHWVCLTNYSSRYDQALDLSNIKRLGISPRVGRIGIPDNAPSNAVNIDCTSYYEKLEQDPILLQSDQPNGVTGMQKDHSWYFGNLTFTKDLFSTLKGEDRTIISTRKTVDGKLWLKQTP